MALVFLGSTTCDLCGEVLNVDDHMVAFPNAIQNELDSLYGFNDQVFHLTCLMSSVQWQSIDLFLKQYSLFKATKICVGCKQLITNPDEYLNLGFLTTDVRNPLFNYNFLEFHREHFNQCSEKKEISAHLQQQKDDKLWRGNRLDWIF
ncbi:hypothetical protein [Chitinophaga arvensicola]|uniref:Uncharacterized protein n=1 Tax=Chitinophaga arvensicola TaxID=29529 RepID=A0A1I0S8S3_9BACT|nr:hypothetical protein [Chitinophaga arvensicola]SEW52503.1 hypothetical protein SAMN04488122_4883 [Chitinophaga arvensicola]